MLQPKQTPQSTMESSSWPQASPAFDPRVSKEQALQLETQPAPIVAALTLCCPALRCECETPQCGELIFGSAKQNLTFKIRSKSRLLT
ncbi:hypothetical protein RRG08_034934 [Elysia crispata]|uniref:Uncharacterized protein n=1 Tax=Elysia crispata TaxID=231223 RepID=A0AAE1CRS1_9GAST|nr:hypothetical protein RRG08_034934 [Elysia crispata]